jgi:GNAT superfamily N-acetyltransferase
MTSSFVIREITEELAQKAKALILDGFLERFGFIDERFNPDLNELLTYYRQKGRRFVVGLKEGELVGTGALVEENTTTGRIVRMSVLKSARRTGLAGQILKHLEEEAIQKGYKGLVLETNKDWESAIRFYQKMGFQLVREDEDQVHFSKCLYCHSNAGVRE